MNLIKKWFPFLSKAHKTAFVAGSMLPQDTSRTTTPTAWYLNDSVTTVTELPITNISSVEKLKDTRIEKKPIEVVKDIVSETPKLELNKRILEEQIKIVSKRRNLLRTELDMKDTRNEDIALGYLNARLKLIKTKANFTWAVTTKAKIDELLKTHKLSKVGFSSYYRNVPMEAVTELEKFLIEYRKVTGVKKGKPELELIIDAGGVEQKKDPILLAKSPIGDWYFILGAWDREVEIVDDLVYHGK